MRRMGRVLMYSGGLDSYCLAHLWPADALVYVKLGSQYQAHEIQALKDAGTPVSYIDMEWLGEFERPDAIIPMRNLFIAAAGAMYGEEVALATTAGDRPLDKDQTFADMATALFERMLGKQSWNDQPMPARVVMPAREWTKHELVTRYLAAGGDMDALVHDTFSCYTPTAHGDECGRCKACWRKWATLRAVGADVHIDCTPHVVKHVLPQIVAGTFNRPQEEREVLMALGITVDSDGLWTHRLRTLPPRQIMEFMQERFC